MDNVLSTLESKLSPKAMATPAPAALKTGHMDHSLTLFETFGNEDNEQTKVKVIQSLACVEFLTCVDFKNACKKALDRADEKDKLCGFKAPEGAKGVEKYGPTRRVLNQRLSEAKQLFGVFKLNPDVLKERGYWNALSIAREYLREGSMKWDATKIDAPEVKEAKQEAKQSMDAIAEMMSQWPQLPGEDRKAYLERIDEKAELAVAIKRQEILTEKVNKVVESLVEKYSEDLLLRVADAIFQKFDTSASDLEEPEENADQE